MGRWCVRGELAARKGKVDDRPGESRSRWCVLRIFAVNRIPVLGGHAGFARCQASIGETSVISGKVEADEEVGCRAYERLRLPRRTVRRAEDINVNLSLSEVLSLLDHADDDEVLAGTSEENRKRALWQFYPTGMLTHSHSDGEFPIYSQGESLNRLSFTRVTLVLSFSHLFVLSPVCVLLSFLSPTFAGPEVGR